jgi:hypothetical protein
MKIRSSRPQKVFMRLSPVLSCSCCSWSIHHWHASADQCDSSDLKSAQRDGINLAAHWPILPIGPCPLIHTAYCSYCQLARTAYCTNSPLAHTAHWPLLPIGLYCPLAHTAHWPILPIGPVLISVTHLTWNQPREMGLTRLPNGPFCLLKI